jgi:hypothetical protein
MAGFTVSNGQILDPSGNVFIAKGINIYNSQINQASNVLSAFPGINMIRLAVQNFASASALTAFVNTMTSHGVVVEIEDHSTSGGSTNNVLTGTALNNELSWYSSIATAFKGNPYVWYGTMNEPDDTANQSATTTQEADIYNTIRSAGATSPIMMSMIGGFSTTVSGGLNPAAYASMTNIVWDAHFYNWQTNHDGTQAASTLTAEIANAQTIHSADGTVPVIIGEYGSSGSDQAQVLAAVRNSGSGNLIWDWYTNDSHFNLSPTGVGTALTTLGANEAAYIAAGNTPPPPPPPPPTTVTVSASSISQTLTNGSFAVTGHSDKMTLIGNNTIADTGGRNTYVLPIAGQGYDVFTTNVLTARDVLNLDTTMYQGTDWNGKAATVPNYLALTSDGHGGGILAVSATSGGPKVAFADFAGVGTNLNALLANAV